LKLFIALTFAAMLALAQTNNSKFNKPTRSDANLAWSVAIDVPQDKLQPITGGGIVEEILANNGVRQAVAVYSQPGWYMIRGVSCSGQELRSEFSIESAPAPDQGAYSQNLYNSRSMEDSFFGLGSLCQLSLFRYHMGRVEGGTVNFEAGTGEMEPQVVGEAVSGESYILTLENLPHDAVVILGRNTVGEIRPTLGKPTVWFKQPWWTNGLTTVTVCSGGRCSTSTYNRKVFPGGVKIPKG
jgi:hypothetical protein